jgi:hypothetical protein
MSEVEYVIERHPCYCEKHPKKCKDVKMILELMTPDGRRSYKCALGDDECDRLKYFLSPKIQV